MSLPPLLRWLQPDRASTVASRLRRPTRAVAFWAAIALPAVYLPLFAVDTPWLPSWTVFVLLGLNILALLVGHSYPE